MRKLFSIILLLIIYNLAISQASFVINLYDNSWITGEEYQNSNYVGLLIILRVINEGNKSDKCDELNSIYLDCNNKNYKYGEDIIMSASYGINEIIHPDDTSFVILLYIVPNDADGLSLKFYNMPEAGSKYVIESFTKWKKNNKNNLADFEYKASKYFSEGNITKSFLYCHKAVALNPKSKAVFTLGNCYIQFEDYDNAIKYYQKSFGIVEDYYIYDNMGYAYIGKKYYYTAIEFFNKAIKYNSKSYDPLLGISIAYYYLGSYDKAKEYYKKAEKINSQLKNGMTGLYYLIETDGVFYGKNEIYALNRICKMLGYDYYE